MSVGSWHLKRRKNGPGAAFEHRITRAVYPCDHWKNRALVIHDCNDGRHVTRRGVFVVVGGAVVFYIYFVHLTLINCAYLHMVTESFQWVSRFTGLIRLTKITIMHFKIGEQSFLHVAFHRDRLKLNDKFKIILELSIQWLLWK